MTFDHLTSPTGLFRAFNWFSGSFTYNPLGYATAAEGFVLLSGVVAGLVYSKAMSKWGIQFITIKAFRRAIDLYKVIVFCCLCIGASSLVFRDWVGNWEGHLNLPLYGERPWVSLLSTGLVYLPSYVEILALYCWFLICLPAVLFLFNRDYSKKSLRYWVALLSLSAGSWVYGQTYPFRSLSQWLAKGASSFWGIDFPVNLGWFDIFSWQLLFVAGLFVGSSLFRRPFLIRRVLKSNVLLIVTIAITVIGFLSRHEIFLTRPSWHDPRVVVPVLGWFRVLNVFSQFYLFCRLLHIVPSLSRCRPLEFLGRSSLQVCAFQAVGCHLLLLWFNQDVKSLQVSTQALLLTMSMGALFIPACYHQYSLREKIVTRSVSLKSLIFRSKASSPFIKPSKNTLIKEK